jgi:chemotaxis family two-component system sensor kinase Cph1
MRKSRDAIAALSEGGDQIANSIAAAGCAFLLRGQVVLLGTTPDRSQVEALAAWLTLNQREHLLATERLSAAYPDAEHFSEIAAGLLSVRVALGSSDFLMWFRPPVVRDVVWAGDPEKPVETSNGLDRINPRQSFARWTQTFRDRSEPWHELDVNFVSSLRPIVAETLFLLVNEEILRLNLELARSNSELSAFASIASHDLQEPIRSIRVYAQLVAQRVGPEMDPQSRGFLATIEDAANRMSSLVSSLLGYSQLGGVELQANKCVNLEDVIKRVTMNLSAQVRDAKAVITHEALPSVFSTDDNMSQLLQNLIGNAIKYRGEPAPRIHIAARLETIQFWLLSISDNGQGFNPAHAGIIFEPFKRLHSRTVPGNGIGLATCKRIVEIHNGRIWAESPGEGQGSTFYFTLPALPAGHEISTV